MVGDGEVSETGDTAIELDALAVREQRASRVPSIVLGAARSGRLVGVATVGSADVERDTAATAATAYRIGSITKTFTAAVLLGLAEAGEIDLDSRVGEFLPDAPFAAVPLRFLLAHSAGLPREVPGDMWVSMQGPDRAALRAAFREVEVLRRPGARWHYSNLGYAVLGQVIEHATGTTCPELINSRVLEPLGLTGTSWTRPDSAAVGYRVDAYADVVHREPDMDQATIGVGGQLWSTAADLLVWGDALAGGAPEVVSPRVVEDMHTLHVMVDQKSWTSGWGLGLILDRRGSRVLAGHTGAMPGFQAALSLDRESRTTAAVLVNATRGAATGRLAGDIVEQLARPQADETPWRPVASIPADVAGVLGRWWSEAEETIFTWRGGGLRAHLAAAPESTDTRFEPDGPDAFRAVSGRLAGERLTVRRDGDGNVTGLVWATYPFTRLPR